MIKPKSFTTFLILSTSAILSSCGGGNNKSKSTYGTHTILAEERVLSFNEVQIATNICYAYQSKSQRFRTTDYGKIFNFIAKRKDCQSVANTYNVAATMKYDEQQNLQYFPPGNFDNTLKFNRKVQTDTSGYLAQLCPKILTNQPVNNTTTQQTVKVQITFMSFPENLGGFVLTYFNKQADNKYLFDSVEIFKVPTTVNDPARGMDQFYSTQKVCASEFDKEETSAFEQTFIPQ